MFLRPGFSVLELLFFNCLTVRVIHVQVTEVTDWLFSPEVTAMLVLTLLNWFDYTSKL